jgi:L-iditol 2-dehydrogenase
VLFSGVQGDVELDAQRLHYDELTVRGAFHHTPATVRAALAFLASAAYPWEKLLTHEIALEQVPAFLAGPPDGYLKAIVRP